MCAPAGARRRTYAAERVALTSRRPLPVNLLDNRSASRHDDVMATTAYPFNLVTQLWPLSERRSR